MWGDTNNTTDADWSRPHLNALNKVGIMKNTTASMIESKGNAILMMQRSAGYINEDPTVTDKCDGLTQLSCLLGGDCPSECSTVVDPVDPVKPGKQTSGKLIVKATAAEGKKVAVPGTSVMDTLTFKTSEDVTISKIVLEQYGYSTVDDVVEVWLEDEDGQIIADPRGMNNKEKVTLSLKKDFKTVDGTVKAKIVVLTTGDTQNGTIGFKVVSVESTAKDLDLDDYTPYEYNMIKNPGKTVTVAINGSNKDYNYEEGESYELAKIKLTPSSDTIVNGFTFANAGHLDVKDSLDKVVVTANNEKVKNLKYNVNKEDELVISFDDVVINMNKSVTFVVNGSFKDFEDYGEDVAYYFEDSTKINAVDKKTSSRVTIMGDYGKTAAKTHTFNGGKIKLSNTKLGKVDAGQASEGTVVAEGKITITEPITKVKFTVTANNTGVDAMTMITPDDEFNAKCSEDGANMVCEFSNVDIENSGKIQFTVDIKDNDSVAGDIAFTPKSFGKDAFD